MNNKNNTVLITGGASGIGLAMAKALIKAGNEVLICGRRISRLEQAREQLPGISIFQCDVTKPADREALFKWVKAKHKDMNVLINNAGIQRFIDFTKGEAALSAGGDEIATNLAAPIHLSALFIPFLSKKPEAAVVNVSSGLGFVPIASMPVYCAAKAGLHSFSVSLRHQLKQTSIKVFELVPPAVRTELGRGPDDTEEEQYPGIEPSLVAKSVLKALKANEYEIVVGEAAGLVKGSKTDFDEAFQRLNSW